MQAMPLINLSRLSLRLGQPKLGLHQASQALEIAREVADPYNTGGALCRLGHAQRALGQAHAELLAEAEAEAIADAALRHTFLTDIPEHQQIVTEAAALG